MSYILILVGQICLVQLNTQVLNVSVTLLLGYYCRYGLSLSFPSGSSFRPQGSYIFLVLKFPMTSWTGTFVFPDARYYSKTTCKDFDYGKKKHDSVLSKCLCLKEQQLKLLDYVAAQISQGLYSFVAKYTNKLDFKYISNWTWGGLRKGESPFYCFFFLLLSLPCWII